MKKILAVLIAISLVATMAFAADINASVTVKAAGNVVKVDDLSKAVDTATWLNEGSEGRFSWSQADAGAEVDLRMSTADEKAGASMALHANKDAELKDDGISLWIKPIDQIKLTFFSANVQLASDANLSWADVQKTEGDYGVTVTPIDGLTIDFVTVKDIADNSHPLLAGKVAYKLDGVATFSAVVNDDEKFGFAIDGVSVGPVSANAYFTSENEVMAVYEKASVAAGPVTLTEVVRVTDFDNPVVPAYVSVAGNVADVALKCEAKWADVQKADKLTVTPSAEIGGNVGAAAWTLGAKLPVDMTGTDTVVGLKIPYSVTMAW